MAGYAARLWDAWKEYEKRHGRLSGVKLAARVEKRIGEPFDDSKLSRIISGKRKATVEELEALALEIDADFFLLATGKRSPGLQKAPEVPAPDTRKKLKSQAGS